MLFNDDESEEREREGVDYGRHSTGSVVRGGRLKRRKGGHATVVKTERRLQTFNRDTSNIWGAQSPSPYKSTEKQLLQIFCSSCLILVPFTLFWSPYLFERPSLVGSRVSHSSIMSSRSNCAGFLLKTDTWSTTPSVQRWFASGRQS